MTATPRTDELVANESLSPHPYIELCRTLELELSDARNARQEGLPPYPVIYDLDYPPDADCDYIDREDYDALRAAAEGMARDAARIDFIEKHSDGVVVGGSGAADDKWFEVIYNDGNRADGGTFRQAIDAARKATP